MSEPAYKRKHKLTAEEFNMLSALVPTIAVNKKKCTNENEFERIARTVGCSSSTVRRFYKKMQDAEAGHMSEKVAATGTNDNTPAPKRDNELLFALMPTIGTHTKTEDCQRIASLVGCCSQTVQNFHKKFLAETTGSIASTALVAAGPSSAPTRACVGGSGGAGAAPCWSAPQVIFQNSSLPIRPAAARPALRCSPHPRVTTAASRRPPDPSLRRRTPSAAFHAGSFRQRRQGPDAPTWRRRVCLPGFQIAARRHS